MRTDHFLCRLLLAGLIAWPMITVGQEQPVVEPAIEQEAEKDATAEQQSPTRTPDLFVPKEKISPDQVIAFPADI